MARRTTGPRIDDHQYEIVNTDTLHEHPRNPNQGDVGTLTELIKRHGFRVPIEVQRKTRFVIAGNHRLKAARALGMPEVPVLWVDVTDREALERLLADNRSRDLAAYDDQQLADLLSELAHGAQGLEGTGFDGDDLDDLLATLNAPVVPDGPQSSPWDDRPLQVADEAKIVKAGDVWTLGPHRIVCADSGLPETWQALFEGGERWSLMWTDPPYGVGYDGNASGNERDQIVGDATPETASAAVDAMLDHAVPLGATGAAVLLAAPAGPALRAFLGCLDDRGILRQMLVWDKGRIGFGRSDYHYAHETLLYGWLPTGAHYRHPDRTRGSIIRVDRPMDSDDHPTQKPVALVVDGIVHHTEAAGAIVVDPFAGSGTTLIACEQTGRTARCIEIDPRYVETVCRRYQEVTGKRPKRGSTAHDFTAG